MEDLLNQLWTQFKGHKAGVIFLFLVVLFGVLWFIALASDIGFGDEVKTYRYWILCSALGLAVFYVIVWSFVFIVQENKRLSHQVAALNQEIGRQNTEREEAGKLSEQKDEEITHLRKTILELSREIRAGHTFEVTKVQYFKERLYLTLKKREEIELRVGNEIRVIDKAEGDIMGVFEVVEVRAADYLARHGSYISPLWMGYVHQTGNAESSMPPESIAVYYPKDVAL